MSAVPIIVAFLLVAHALIHLSFVSPRPPATAAGPAWPFDLERSRVLARLGSQPTALRPAGLALLAIVLAGYGLAAVAALGVGGATLFAVGVAAGSLASLAMLLLFFHPWLTIGVVIDVALLVAALAGWYPA